VRISEEELGRIIFQIPAKRDERDKEKLFKAFYGYAMGVGLRYLNNRDDVEELVNDSFMKVFNHPGTFESLKPFKVWLGRIVANGAIDRLRAAKKWKNMVDVEEHHQLSSPVSSSANTEYNELLSLLNKLPDNYRLIFNLHEVDGFSHEEIAEQMGIPESTSRVYLMRARKKLQEYYKIQYKTSYEVG
jgi:RNA polymerase sigma factor (sigma-70 family)